MSEQLTSFERLLTELTERCASSSVCVAQEGVESPLALVRGFLESDFLILVALPEPGTNFQAQFIYDLKDPGFAAALNSETVRQWLWEKTILAAPLSMVSLQSLSGADALELEPLISAGGQSLYLIPLQAENQPTGALVIGYSHEVHELSQVDVARCRCLGSLIGHQWIQSDRIERLTGAIEAAESGLWALELSTLTYWATDTARLMHGFMPTEVVSLEMVLAKVHPDDRQLIKDANAFAASAPGNILRVEYRVTLPDGSVRWMLARGRSETGNAAAPSRIMGVVNDITERKIAEDELRDARALTDAVFDSVPGLIYLYTQDGKLVRWNKQHEIFSGYTHAELENFHATDWFTQDGSDKLMSEWARVFAEGSSSLELKIKKKDGTLVPYFFTGVRVEIEGQPHMVGIGIDMSDKVRSEQELAQLQKELLHATRVSVMGELASALAHELNQPLAAILSNAQAARRLLRASPPDIDEVRAALDDIVSDDKRAGEIIHGLRALMAKGESKSVRLDLNQLIRAVASLLHGEFVAADVATVFDLAPDLPTITAGHTELQQVLMNLMMNGIDAQRSLSKESRCLTVTSSADSHAVTVSIRDEGIGITSEDLRNIFEPFHTTKANGLGMGLAICRRIIEHYGGRIWAENNPDRGATFRFELPHG